MPAKKKNFYAVKNGRRKGIYRTWPECQAQVLGFKGAKFRGFPTLKETKDWLGPEVLAEDGFVHMNEDASATSGTSNMREEVDPVSGEKRKMRKNGNNKVGMNNKREKLDETTSAALVSNRKMINAGKGQGLQVNNDVHRLEMVMHFDGGSRGNTGEIAGAGAQLVITETSAPTDDEGTINEENPPERDEKIGEHADGGAKKKQVHIIKTIVEMREYLREDPEQIKTNTNNVAEYTGLIVGMREILNRLQQFAKNKPSSAVANSRPHVYISIFGDSLLVINQMKGLYRCKSLNLKSFHEDAKTLEEKIKKLEDDVMSIHLAHLQYDHCYRENNEDADRLANEAMDSRTSWKTVDVQKTVEQKREDEGNDWV